MSTWNSLGAEFEKISYCEESKGKNMDHEKKRVEIKNVFGVDPLFLVRCLLADPLHVDQDDHIEEEGDEDEDDAAEDPNCEGCQPG